LRGNLNLASRQHTSAQCVEELCPVILGRLIHRQFNPAAALR
jgi:hypothetical protein